MRYARRAGGIAVLGVAVVYLVSVVDARAAGTAVGAALRRPWTLLGALALYAAAFGARTWAWCRVLPGLGAGQAWAALHVSLAGNHVLPFRLGEALRVTSVLRRTGLPAAPVTASALVLRCADLLSVLGLALVGAPALFDRWAPAALALVAVLVLLGGGALGWLVRLRRAGVLVRIPGPGVGAAVGGAWLLEAAVMWAAAGAAGLAISYPAAVAVTAVTIAAQSLAVTPGGIGSYEAAATAALVGLGAPAGPALAAALVAHAAKTAYALVLGAIALVWPDPGYFGRLRLARGIPRPAASPVADGPVVVFIPAYNEAAVVGSVVRRVPSVACGRSVRVLVIDDGSSDGTAAQAAAAGAVVLRQPGNLGLGAAVRRGLREAVALAPACVVYLDADGEYAPEEVPLLAAPVLAGDADYVVGSRFRGGRRRMRPQRVLGNVLLTRWVRWMTRQRGLSDGQSGYRAFSAAAAASAQVIHDYNYAQVLTLNLLGKGFRYAEVPISYTFRTTGTSYIRITRYLRRVLPAVHRELNRQSSTTCSANRLRAPAQAAGSR
jgi:uncharacterized membrane protein YbhN (UPF0104 family)